MEADTLLYNNNYFIMVEKSFWAGKYSKTRYAGSFSIRRWPGVSNIFMVFKN